MKIILKFFVRTLAIGIAGLSIVTAQEQCKSMQVYLPIGPNIRQDVLSEIAPALQKRFGTQLVIEEMAAGTMLDKVAAQGASPRVSVVFWGFPVGFDACQRGFCKPIDMTKATNMANLDSWAYIKDKNDKTVVVGSVVYAIGLLYNEDQLKKNQIPAPTSWTDLGRKDFQGRVSITSPLSTYGLGSLLMLAKINGGDAKNIDSGFKAAKGLLPTIHGVHTFTSELANLLQLNEVWLATTGSNVVSDLRSKGVPVRWVAPKEGAAALLGGASMVANAPCETEAYAFLNTYYSDEFQARRTIAGDASVKRQSWDLLTADQLSAQPLKPSQFDSMQQMDWTVISQYRADWIKRWQRDIR